MTFTMVQIAFRILELATIAHLAPTREDFDAAIAAIASLSQIAGVRS